MRPYLLYVSSKAGHCEAQLNPDRNFDIAFNDWTKNKVAPKFVEHPFSVDKFKFRHIGEDLIALCSQYQVCAFFDDDVRVSTHQLNDLFRIGHLLQFNIWQATLDEKSHTYWKHHRTRPRSYIRPTNCVDLMMPFFSKSAFEKCARSFLYNYSGFGLEILWDNWLQNRGIMLFDCISVTHTRGLVGGSRRMPNGLTSDQEVDPTLAKARLTKPKEVW